MPEAAEVAHVCALLRRNIIGSRIIKLNLNNDPLLFPLLKNNDNAESDLRTLHDTMINSTVASVSRHGKYFWLRLNLEQPEQGEKTGVLLMHFGMTGMIKIRNVKSHVMFMENGGDKKVLEKLKQESTDGSKAKKVSKYFADKGVKKEDEEIVDTVHIPKPEKERAVGRNQAKPEIEEEEQIDNGMEEWPPKFVKFDMELADEKRGAKLELAFVDPRRLARVRLLTGPNVQTDEALLNEEPLKALGPDYSKPREPPSSSGKDHESPLSGDVDPDHHGRPALTLEEFNKLVLSKKKPIKSLLLDQDQFAGVGNWMSDEICYHARIHPNEVISSKLDSSDQPHEVVKNLYDALVYVCSHSVELEGDVGKFPDDWLMLYRWGKGRKSQPKAKTKAGYTVEHVTVGGRTSCFVPDLQQPLPQNGSAKPKEKAPKEKAPKGKASKRANNEGDDVQTPTKRPRRSRK